jgi:hypothetical protein
MVNHNANGNGNARTTKTELQLERGDWELVHRYRNTRALARRKSMVDYRAGLERKCEAMLAESVQRGIPNELMMQWRAYPKRDGGPLSFGHKASVTDAGIEVESTPPANAQRRKHDELAPAPEPDGAELLRALEASLRLNRNGSTSSHNGNGHNGASA